MKAAFNPAFGVLAVVISASAILLAQRTQPFERIDAGGHELRLLVMGTGTPTVILENGLGPPLSLWAPVQRELAKTATTVAYDRAGVAGSDAGPLPRDARTIASELHTMLAKRGLPPPYILTGHSFGGLYIRVFAAMYPDEVGALVLVDPTRHDEFDLENLDGSANPEAAAAAATMLQARDSTLPAGVPVYLIVATGPQAPPYPLKNAEEYVRGRREDLEAHTAWLEQTESGRLIVSPDNGHTVIFEDPDLVIDTILKAIAAASAP